MFKKANGKNILLTVASISILGGLGGCGSLPSKATTFDKTYIFNYADNFGAKGRICKEPTMVTPDGECNVSSYIKNGQLFKYEDHSASRVVSLTTNSDGKGFSKVNQLLMQYPRYSKDKTEAQVQVRDQLFSYEKGYKQGEYVWVQDIGYKPVFGCHYTDPNPKVRLGYCGPNLPPVIKLKSGQKVAFSIFDIEYLGDEMWRIFVPSDGKTTGELPDSVICGKGVKDCQSLF